MKILLVEDEEKIRKITKSYLEKNGFLVDEAEDGEKALDLLSDNKYNLVILDIMLPKMNGWELCKEIKEVYEYPVMMLTARRDEEDEIKGLQLGADDYLKKPYSLKVLVVKINKLLNLSDTIHFKDIEVNQLKKTVKQNGERLELTPKEYELLTYLLMNQDKTLSRDQILNSVWDVSYYGDTRIVDTFVKTLRKKIGFDYIKTVRNFGYTMED